MAVAVSGSLAYDTRFAFEGRFEEVLEKAGRPNFTCQSRTVRTDFGGCAGNIAYGLKLLGQEPVILSAAGGEDFEAYERHLAALKITTKGIRVLAGRRTACASITTDALGRQITTFCAAALDEADATPLPLEGVTLAILTANPAPLMRFHEEAFVEAAVPFVFDPGPSVFYLDKADLARFARRAFCSIMNETEWRAFEKALGTTRGEALALCGRAAVTRGEKGLTLHNGEKALDIPAVRVAGPNYVVGAGDALRAGLLAKLSEGEALEDALAFGTRVAASKILHDGAQGYRL